CRSLRVSSAHPLFPTRRSSDLFVPEVRSQDRTKGQQEGKAVTGITGSPRVENPGLASGNSAGQNNSNLTPYAASVANGEWELLLDRKSTRLNSSHVKISYAVFC